MMAITNAQLAALADLTPANMLIMWKQAEAAIAMTGQAYTSTGRSLTRADLAEVREQVKFWQGQVDLASTDSSGGIVLVQRARAV